MDAELLRLNEKTVLAQYGPMRLTIEAWGGNGPDLALAERAGEFAFTLLPRLVPAMDLFRLQGESFEGVAANFDEPLLNRMVLGARRTMKPDLGPMATVAGLVAETVAKWLRDAGACKAIVENGGDLGIYLAPGEVVRVGVRLGVTSSAPEFSLPIAGDTRPFWGIASSGLGGRSLTQGIADSVMCVADNSVDADACATAIASTCLVDSPAVVRVPAEQLRPETDIRGLLVTESVGELSQKEISMALDKAHDYAEKLVEQGIILGAFLSLRSELRLTRNFDTMVGPLVRL